MFTHVRALPAILAIVLGLKTRYAALLMALFTISATLTNWATVSPSPAPVLNPSTAACPMI